MDDLEPMWHFIHTRDIRRREKSRPTRVAHRKLGLQFKGKSQQKRIPLNVPKVVSFSGNYEETVGFIDRLKFLIFEKKQYVFLNFRNCIQISSEACVVLAAEIDRCRKKIPYSVTGSYPSSPTVYFFLNEVGFFSLLKISALPPTFDNSPDIQAVRLESGVDNPENLMRGIKGLFHEDGSDEPSDYSGDVYRALTEAMGNAVEHAYPDSFQKDNAETCVPNWWRAGFKIKQDNDVLIILYDQGAGIPNTLDTNWSDKLENFFRELARKPKDDEKIVIAMEKGRSRTKKPGRGQGSYDMQTLIRKSSHGALSIFSYRGRYVYRNDGTWACEELKTSLKGTLIAWHVRLETEKEQI